MNIVLIDDEYISSFVNRKLIERVDASLEITEFNDSEEAFDQLRLIDPDLIFLDINMPGMNGWNFLDKMAAEKLNHKVVVLTSSINTKDRKMAQQYNNVIGYIEKPAAITTIKSYISELTMTAVA